MKREAKLVFPCENDVEADALLYELDDWLEDHGINELPNEAHLEYPTHYDEEEPKCNLIIEFEIEI